MVLAGALLLLVGIAIGAGLGRLLPIDTQDGPVGLASQDEPPAAPESPPPSVLERTAEAPPPRRVESQKRTVGARAPSRTEEAVRRDPSVDPASAEAERLPSPATHARAESTDDSQSQRPSRDDTAGMPAWRRYAAVATISGDRPLIAIVIDDLGANSDRSRRVVNLPGPLTLAFLPYADNLPAQAALARAAGHELLVHLPMEPVGEREDPGPNALLTGLDQAELLRRLRWGLGRFEGYVGINNHMGSRFTAWEPGMRLVMNELSARGLLFLDSRTSRDSVGEALAAEVGVPHLRRHVFLDNERTSEAITAQLAATEELARSRGYAVAIGHPSNATLTALEHWLPDMLARGFELVPIAALVARNGAVSEQAD